jgi:uncharacterized protein
VDVGKTAIGEADRSIEGHGRTAMVTGASSGIGRSLAELLAAKGYDVIPVARRAERLDELARQLEARWGVTVTPKVADLGRPDAASEILQWLAADGRAVDVLVNNAGNSRIGRYDELPWAVHMERLQLMVLTSWQLTHGVLPGMVQRRWGRIINLSSIAGLFTGFPRDVTYGAIKNTIVAFSEGIDAEYRKLGIRSTVSLPGPTATEIFTTPGSAADMGAEFPAKYLQTASETVARQTYAAVMVGKPWIVPGRPYRAVAMMLEHSPRPVRRVMSRAFCSLM